MKKIWRPMLIVGIVLLSIVLIVTPFMFMQISFTSEPVASYDTPLEVFACVYWRRVVESGLWIWLLVIGVALTVAAAVMRIVVRKQR